MWCMCSRRTRLAALLLALACVAGCAAQSSGEAKLLTDGQAGAPSNVRTAELNTGSLYKEFTMSAEVSYVRKTVVRLEQDGAQYVETCVSAGQTVQAGDVLAVFRGQGDELRLTAIAQELARLETETQDALYDLDKQREQLLEQREQVAGTPDGYSTYRDSVSCQVIDMQLERLELQRQQIELRAAERERALKAERRELQSAGTRIEIVAPEDGVVGQVQYLTAGAQCARGQAVVTLYDPDEFLLMAGEGLTGALRVGQRVEVEYGRFNQRTRLAGTVVAADSALSERYRTGLSAVRLDEPIDPQLLLSVTVYSAQLSLDGVPVLPRSAVLYDGGMPYVNLVQDGAVSRRNVLIGPNDGTSIMVLAGLDPGMPVAVN